MMLSGAPRLPLAATGMLFVYNILSFVVCLVCACSDTCLVVSGVSVHVRVLCRQVRLLVATAVCDVSVRFPGGLSQLGLLTCFLGRLLHGESLLQVVQLDCVEALSLVESNLDSARSQADSLHVILINHRADDVSRTGKSLKVSRLEVGGQVSQGKVNNLGLAIVIIGGERVGTGEGVAAGEEGLFGGFGGTSWNAVGRGLVVLLSNGSGCVNGLVEGGCEHALLLALRVIVLVGGFKATHALLELVVGLAAGLGGRGNALLSVVHIDGLLGDRGVGRVVGLFEDSGRELLLSLLESVDSSGASVNRLGSSGFVLPVGGSAESNLSDIGFISGLLSVGIATAKDTRLKLTVLAVLVASIGGLVDLLLGRSLVGGRLTDVFPISSGSHQSTVAFVGVIAVTSGRLSVQFAGLGLVSGHSSNGGVSGLRLGSGGRLGNQTVLGARVEISGGGTEKSGGAGACTSESGTSALFRLGSAKNTTVKRVLLTLRCSTRGGSSENIALVSSVVALADIFVGGQGSALDGTSGNVFSAEQVGVLVGSTSDLLGERFLVEVLVAALLVLGGCLAVGLVVEGIGLEGVGLSGRGVAGAVSLSVADQISAVLALLETSCFTHFV